MRYTYSGQVFQAEYQSGILVNADDTSLTYNSFGSFGNSCNSSGGGCGSVNGLDVCKVLRNDVWKKINDLPWIDLEEEPVKVSKKMPPQMQRKKPATIQKAAIVQPAEPQTIIAGIIVKPEPLIVKTVRRVTLIPSGDKWLNEDSGETYTKDSNGGVASS